MGLSLVVGPARVGKVALLLERYLDVLERETKAATLWRRLAAQAG